MGGGNPFQKKKKKMNNARCPAVRRRRRGEAAPSGEAASWLHCKGNEVRSSARCRLYPVTSRVSGRAPTGLGKPKLLRGVASRRRPGRARAGSGGGGVPSRSTATHAARYCVRGVLLLGARGPRHGTGMPGSPSCQRVTGTVLRRVESAAGPMTRRVTRAVSHRAAKLFSEFGAMILPGALSVHSGGTGP